MSDIGNGLIQLGNAAFAYADRQAEREFREEQLRIQQEELRRQRRTQLQSLSAQNAWNAWNQEFEEKYKESFSNYITDDINYDVEQTWEQMAAQKKNEILGTIDDDYARELMSAQIDEWTVAGRNTWFEQQNALENGRYVTGISGRVTSMMSGRDITGARDFVMSEVESGRLDGETATQILSSSIEPAAKQELQRLALQYGSDIYIFGGEDVTELEKIKESMETEEGKAAIQERIDTSNRINSLVSLVPQDQRDDERKRLDSIISDQQKKIKEAAQQEVSSFEIRFTDALSNRESGTLLQLREMLYPEDDSVRKNYFAAGDQDGYRARVKELNDLIEEARLQAEADATQADLDDMKAREQASQNNRNILGKEIYSKSTDITALTEGERGSRMRQYIFGVRADPRYNAMTPEHQEEIEKLMNTEATKYLEESGSLLTEQLKLLVNDNRISTTQNSDAVVYYTRLIDQGYDDSKAVAATLDWVVAKNPQSVFNGFDFASWSPDGVNKFRPSEADGSNTSDTERLIAALGVDEQIHLREQDWRNNTVVMSHLQSSFDRNGKEIAQRRGYMDEGDTGELIFYYVDPSTTYPVFQIKGQDGRTKGYIRPTMESPNDKSYTWRAVITPSANPRDALDGQNWINLNNYVSDERIAAEEIIQDTRIRQAQFEDGLSPIPAVARVISPDTWNSFTDEQKSFVNGWDLESEGFDIDKQILVRIINDDSKFKSYVTASENQRRLIRDGIRRQISLGQ